MKMNPWRRPENGGFTCARTNDKKKNGWGQIILFIVFLILLALVLNGMGWCIGGVCDVGTEMLLK